MEPSDPDAAPKCAIARALPPHWPTLSLPRADATPLPTAAPSWLVSATMSAEEASWAAPAKEKAPATPSSSKKGKAAATPPSGKKAKKLKEQHEERNQAGTLCKCGKEDTERVCGPSHTPPHD